MPTEVLATPRAEQQIAGLSRKLSKSFESFLNDLAAGGCKALAYRLSGDAPVNHICAKHLSGSLRVVVAFETPQRAWILLVGPHDDQDPILNVYAELYSLLGADPQPAAGRDKPPCCDKTGELPPVLGNALVEILDRAAKSARPGSRDKQSCPLSGISEACLPRAARTACRVVLPQLPACSLEWTSMERVAIVGCEGSGKSWLARQPGQIPHVPVTHLGDVFYDEHGTSSRQISSPQPSGS
jgi:hypothetical protein